MNWMWILEDKISSIRTSVIWFEWFFLRATPPLGYGIRLRAAFYKIQIQPIHIKYLEDGPWPSEVRRRRPRGWSVYFRPSPAPPSPHFMIITSLCNCFSSSNCIMHMFNKIMSILRLHIFSFIHSFIFVLSFVCFKSKWISVCPRSLVQFYVAKHHIEMERINVDFSYGLKNC